MKYTLCVTQRCNLRCRYCYIAKRDRTMPIDVAVRIVDFAFLNTPQEERIDIGFFGGEPLLEFERIRNITSMIEAHPKFDPGRVDLSVVSNGTIFSEEIADYLRRHKIALGISCDGPPSIQDAFRTFPDGSGSSPIVEQNLRRALGWFPDLPVNAVHSPATLPYLADTVDHLAALGVAKIYLNTDYSARWTRREADLLPDLYARVADRYVEFHERGEPRFISLIDSKIAVILRRGYRPLERCRMGRGEYAFSPSGNIYPCERLIGNGDGGCHCIGNIVAGLSPGAACAGAGDTKARNAECLECGLSVYCMNWCGCSNYFASGAYDKVGPFLCASERTAIMESMRVFQRLEERLGPTFVDHLSGLPWAASLRRTTTAR